MATAWSLTTERLSQSMRAGMCGSVLTVALWWSTEVLDQSSTVDEKILSQGALRLSSSIFVPALAPQRCRDQSADHRGRTVKSHRRDP